MMVVKRSKQATSFFLSLVHFLTSTAVQMDSDLSKLKAKPRVHFGSLEETDVVKRPRIEEPTSLSLSAGGIDLEALGKA